MVTASTRTFIWEISGLTLGEVKSYVGRGLVLTNIDTWVDIGFGVFYEPAGYASYEETAKDIIALCQESEKLSMMLYS